VGEGVVSLSDTVPLIRPYRISGGRGAANFPWTPDRRIWRDADGQPVRWRGLTGFKAGEIFSGGNLARLADWLGHFDDMNYNVVRLFAHAVGPGWEVEGWETVPDDALIDCVKWFGDLGYGVEYVLLTDDASARIPTALRQIGACVSARLLLPNLFLQGGNEPTTHKAIDTQALHLALRASGFNYCSGDFEDPTRWFGSYFTVHTPRDGEWPRKSKDLMDYFGGNTGTTASAFNAPGVADEPQRPDAAGAPSPEAKRQDFYAYAAIASLFGAGATFHSKLAEYIQMPTEEDVACAQSFSDGLSVFPADAPNGAYRRIDENGATLRTYIVGNYMVRARPTTMSAPEPGWQPLDTMGICWRR
jgi:hypothetical protein